MTLLAANTTEKPDFAKEKSTSTNNTQAEGRDSSGALKKNSDIGLGSQTQNSISKLGHRHHHNGSILQT